MMPQASRPKKRIAGLYRLANLFLACNPVSEAVTTHAHFSASADTVWDHLAFYEEIPTRAPLILRALLTDAIRTKGNKTRPGAIVSCEYAQGYLIKRIKTVAPPSALQFDVLEQRLGIESCILARGGSYQIHSAGDAADVELTTKYWTFLRPRFLWRFLEAYLVHQLHKHILRGVRSAILAASPARSPVAEVSRREGSTSGGLACTISRSSSRH